MDDLNIGTTILHLRKGKGLTQEQLAGMIGISAGAVSKWETGSSTPDITLLAPLARALNTSLNELLSFHEELSDIEITEIKQELTEIFLHSSFPDGEKKCKEYLNKYPNSIALKLNVAGLIQMFSRMLGDAFNELINEKMQYALSLLYQVVDSKDTKHSQLALFLIASIQMQLENYAESEKCIKQISTPAIDPKILYVSILQKQDKYEEAEKLCKSMLLKHLFQTTTMLSALANIAKKNHNIDKALLYLNTLNQIQDTFKFGLSSAAYALCRLYIEQDEKQLAAKWLKTYVDGLVTAEYDYSSNPYFANIQLEVKPEGQRVVRKNMVKELIEQEELKVLSDTPEYTEAIQQLKAFIF
jgi:transcriptional regulator with XRE-family HTH domain